MKRPDATRSTKRAPTKRQPTNKAPTKPPATTPETPAAFHDAAPLVTLINRPTTDPAVKGLKSRGFRLRRPKPFPGDPQETHWVLGRDVQVLAEDGVVVNVWLGFQWDGGLPGGLKHGMTQQQVRATLGPLDEETAWNDFFCVDGHRWRLTYNGDRRYMSMSIQAWHMRAVLEERSRRHDALAAAKEKEA